MASLLLSFLLLLHVSVRLRLFLSTLWLLAVPV
jgi:hypothetical protein